MLTLAALAAEVAVPSGTALHRGEVTARNASSGLGKSPSLRGRPFIEAAARMRASACRWSRRPFGDGPSSRH